MQVPHRSMIVNLLVAKVHELDSNDESVGLPGLEPGATVIVTLRKQANVQLMTRAEYGNYKAGRHSSQRSS